MSPGQIVAVDWRDALPGSGEPNKRRPAIVVGAPDLFGGFLPFELVVPLTGEERLAIDGASLAIEPSPQNGCTKRSYALAWCVQTVSQARIAGTPSRITDHELATIHGQIGRCLGLK